MAQIKDPAARASARPAVAPVESGDTQIDLPLFPENEGIFVPGPGSEKKRCAPVKGGVGKGPENISSREEKSMRHARINSPISVVTIKRVVAAAKKAGMVIGELEVRADGTIRIVAPASAERQSADVFAEWASRL
ncbi:hypothetical protein [uncultured Sphingomonas sp.]|uniref:hypothetical protein n=1 Tax=uncultured Sphingomonas sp. TaxID=158754 RepID=UPI002639CD19|nr:hypothetical protein [uncultured Sphingomonas sp.]